MQFFQFQQERNVDFKCVHIKEINQKSTKAILRLTKKPYERYKDMRLAIKLIEKGENPIFRTLDDPPSPLIAPTNALNASFTFPHTHSHLSFPPHRLKVGCPASKNNKYRSYLVRTASVDRMRLAY